MAHTYTDIGTHKYMHIQTHTDSDADTISHLHFWLNWHTCQRYKFYIWHTTDIHRHSYTQIHIYMYRHTQRHTNVQAHIDTGTHRCIHTHTDAHRHTLRHTHTCMFVHTHTHTDVHMGNVRKLLLQTHF